MRHAAIGRVCASRGSFQPQSSFSLPHPGAALPRSPGVTRRGFLETLAASALAPSVLRLDAQSAGETSLAERLGYPADARLLIINADDLGITHSANAASMAALEAGVITSASAMPACPWFPEIAAYARAHPQFDIGVHLAVTSERTGYRWGPVLGPSRVPSLVDGSGYFPTEWYPDYPANPAELEAELVAQTERAIQLGTRPSHFDSHSHYLQLSGARIYELFCRVAARYRAPVRVGTNWLADHPYLRTGAPGGVIVDRVITIPPTVNPDQWLAWYLTTVDGLSTGVTELVVHLGYNDGEMRAFIPSAARWGSSWRQRDFDAMMSPVLKATIARAGVRLLTWREVARLVTG